MHAEHPIILLLEDCPVTGLLVERAVMNAIPNCRLLWARGVDEAVRRAEGLQVELFLVDIGLPDGSGLDFLWSMSTAHPSARAIVMTASALPEYQMSSAALGVLNFLQKPLNLGSLVEQVRIALDAEQMGSGNGDFRATLENVTPVDILQLKCLSGATTLIDFRSGAQTGSVHLLNGEIVHATTGNIKGTDALCEIISWQHGQLSEQPRSPLAEKTITSSWQSLLMHAAQRLDEACGARA